SVTHSGSRGTVMKVENSITLGLLSVVFGTACQFSASASGEVNTAGTSQAEADASFSTEEPEPEPAPTEQKAIVYKEGKLDYRGVINWESDKAALKDAADTTTTLAEFENFLKQHSEVSIEIEGHTDSRGSDDYNRDLSERRANSVRDWLIAKGIAAERVS